MTIGFLVDFKKNLQKNSEVNRVFNLNIKIDQFKKKSDELKLNLFIKYRKVFDKKSKRSTIRDVCKCFIKDAFHLKSILTLTYIEYNEFNADLKFKNFLG